jgi:two-component system sensor histidine kinase KdpD
MLAARTQARATAELYAFGRKLTGLADLDELLRTTAHQVATTLRVSAVLLLPGHDGKLEARAAWPPEDRLDAADLPAAHRAWEHNRPTGRDADALPAGRRLFLPLRTAGGRLGVIGVTRAAPGPLLTPDEHRLLGALLDQAALAIERVQLARHVEESRLLAETERLRAALLTSVSHDLKTPLASILGAITSLRTYGALYDTAAREEMLATAQEEAERLARFLGNVLDISRLEGGAVGPRREPVDLADVVGSALRRVDRLLAGHRVTTDLPADLPLLSLDFILTEQVVVNLLENAARHTPRSTTIEIIGRRGPKLVTLEVRDEGPGLAPGEAECVFDKFYRGRDGDRQGGTGLGLAVCRGFIEAMGGTILAHNREDRPGSVFRVAFPRALAAELPAELADAPV